MTESGNLPPELQRQVAEIQKIIAGYAHIGDLRPYVRVHREIDRVVAGAVLGQVEQLAKQVAAVSAAIPRPKFTTHVLTASQAASLQVSSQTLKGFQAAIAAQQRSIRDVLASSDALRAALPSMDPLIDLADLVQAVSAQVDLEQVSRLVDTLEAAGLAPTAEQSENVDTRSAEHLLTFEDSVLAVDETSVASEEGGRASLQLLSDRLVAAAAVLIAAAQKMDRGVQQLEPVIERYEKLAVRLIGLALFLRHMLNI
jgi:hypothetical protein